VTAEWVVDPKTKRASWSNFELAESFSPGQVTDTGTHTHDPTTLANTFRARWKAVHDLWAETARNTIDTRFSLIRKFDPDLPQAVKQSLAPHIPRIAECLYNGREYGKVLCLTKGVKTDVSCVFQSTMGKVHTSSHPC
jgi:hypothetical protein